MATYTVKAPDGKTVTLDGPDDASEADVIAQAQKLYQPPATAPVNSSPTELPANSAPSVEDQRAQARQIQQMVMDPNAKRADIEAAAAGHPTIDPAGLKKVLDFRDSHGAYAAPIFEKSALTDPATNPVPAAPDVDPKQAAIDAGAAAHGEQNAAQTGNFLTALKGGVTRGLFGIPERLAAAGEAYLPSAITGNDTDASYDDILKVIRGNTDADMGKSLPGAIAGSVVGGVAGGVGAGGLISKGAEALAGVGEASGVASRVGNALQELATPVKGEVMGNTAKLLLAGGVGGAAQGVGEGTDPLTGAAYGVLGAGVLGAGGKILAKAGGLGRALARSTSTSLPKAIQEVIKESPEVLAARHAALSDRTGSNVPLAAALNDQDFKTVAEQVLQKSPEAMTAAKGKAGQYLKGFMDRMLSHVNAAGVDKDGNTVAPQVAGIGDLSEARTNTANEIMAPIANAPVDMSTLPLDKVERSVTKAMGSRITGLGPRLSAALADLPPDAAEGLSGADIARSRDLMNKFGLGEPVHATVKEMDGLRRSLNAAGQRLSASNPVEGQAMKSAATVIANHVADAHPAYRQMLDSYAAQSRMMEGFETAGNGTRLEDVADDALRNNLRTSEGKVGMAAGELWRLRSNVAASPTKAISTAKALASGGELTRPASLDPGAALPGTVTSNIGDGAAAKLADASDAESTVLGRMIDTNKVAVQAHDQNETLSPEEIIHGAFLGHALPATKARWVLNFVNKHAGINPQVAENLGTKLFSGHADDTAEAMRALQHLGYGRQAAAASLQAALPAGFAAGQTNAAIQASTPPVAPTHGPSTDSAFDIAEPSGGAGNAGEDPFAIQDPSEVAPAEPAASTVPVTPSSKIISDLFPEAHITETIRDPKSKLGRANPNSYHDKTDNAVDVRPIPGMTFNDFVAKIHAAGHTIIEARDEVHDPVKWATGPHWHVVIA